MGQNTGGWLIQSSKHRKENTIAKAETPWQNFLVGMQTRGLAPFSGVLKQKEGLRGL